MSRILRRPMFRGGRVDSRGTGITSGLSYAKGGSVDTPKRGFVDGPGGYSGLTFEQRQNIIDFNKQGGAKYSEDLIRKRFNKYMDNLYTGDIPDVDIAYGMQMVPDPSTKESAIAQTFQEDPKQAYTEFKSGLYDNINYAQKQKEESAIAKLAGLDMSKYGIPEEVPPPPAKKLPSGTGEPSSDDLLNIDKEKFAKLLGGDKARGEDISNMLLSFAGKALKPEATVKGAFGEFFEEEAKRPSSKTKVDQAAAQLAINKYIKGEISKAELAKLIAMNSMKTNLGDRAYIADQFKTSTSFSNAVKDGIQRNPQRRGQSIRFKEVNSDQMLPENFKPGPEDIGIIFIETDTQTAYEYDNNLQRVEIYSR